jgi:hypothetical protein
VTQLDKSNGLVYNEGMPTTQTTSHKLAADLVHGDAYPHPLDDSRPVCHVDRVEPTGTYKFGTDIPMLAVFLLDGPKVVKNVQMPADRVIVTEQLA